VHVESVHGDRTGSLASTRGNIARESGPRLPSERSDGKNPAIELYWLEMYQCSQ
jgi:hypothetical protein